MHIWSGTTLDCQPSCPLFLYEHKSMIALPAREFMHPNSRHSSRIPSVFWSAAEQEPLPAWLIGWRRTRAWGCRKQGKWWSPKQLIPSPARRLCGVRDAPKPISGTKPILSIYCIDILSMESMKSVEIMASVWGRVLSSRTIESDWASHANSLETKGLTSAVLYICSLYLKCLQSYPIFYLTGTSRV